MCEQLWNIFVGAGHKMVGLGKRCMNKYGNCMARLGKRCMNNYVICKVELSRDA